MKEILVKICICFSYFMVSGLATTNILRLLKGSTLHVYSSKCVCPNCGMKIGVLNQTPIISYIVNRGKWKKCKNPIPKNALFLEILLFIGMSIVTIVFQFSHLGVLFSFCFYELVKIGYIIWYGRREESFLCQYLLSFLSIFATFGIVEFMALLLQVK